MKLSRRSDAAGFTLIEVLVALAVTAIGAALALSLISGVLANIRKVQVRTRNVQHAETVLELALVDESIRQATSLRGDFEDGTRWVVDVQEFPVPPDPSLPVGRQQQLPIKLLIFTADVAAPDSNSTDFRLQTIKVVSTPESVLGAPRLPQ